MYDGHLEKPHAIKTRTINFGDYSLKYDIKSVTSTVLKLRLKESNSNF